MGVDFPQRWELLHLNVLAPPKLPLLTLAHENFPLDPAFPHSLENYTPEDKVKGAQLSENHSVWEWLSTVDGDHYRIRNSRVFFISSGDGQPGMDKHYRGFKFNINQEHPNSNYRSALMLHREDSGTSPQTNYVRQRGL